jgi:hypothetical protein
MVFGRLSVVSCRLSVNGSPATENRRLTVAQANWTVGQDGKGKVRKLIFEG